MASETGGVRPTTGSPLRPYLAIAIVYFCCVAGLWGIASLFMIGKPQLTAFIMMRLLFLITATLGLLALGRDGVADVFGYRPGRVWLAIGPAFGLLIYGINCLWVVFAATVRGTPIPYLSGEATFQTVLLAPILVAYTEELVFRGVLWAAIARVSRSWVQPLVQTSVLFALVHLVNGDALWELPHRFVAGLLLGFLRVRSGSIVPAVHAHFVLLALATVG